MADYAGQANAIYDPQAAAETAGLNAEKATTAASFGGETNAANNAYTEALKTLGETEKTGEASNAFHASTQGLFSSGLLSNAQRLTYAKYQEGVDTTANLRAQKLSDIAARAAAADQGYNAKLGALSSKYAGLKAEYVAKNQNAEAAAAQKFAQQQELAAERASLRGPKAPTAQDRQAAFNQDLEAAFSAANQAGAYHPFIREQVAQALAGEYGVSLPEAQKQVNSLFTDSWDNGKRGAK